MKGESTIGTAPFDEIAKFYDDLFSHTPVGILQRKRVHHYLWHALSSAPMSILELNSGTGEDAVWLAQKGHHVTATDYSGKMIERCNEKIRQCHLEDLVTAHRVAFRNLREEFPGQSFDLVFSDFGGLNCISKEDLGKVAEDIAGLLKPGAKCISVIMGKKCAWEFLYFLQKGKLKNAVRRNTKESLEVKVGDSIQETWYHSPGDIRNIFGPKFRIEKVRPIGIAIPPSYLNSFFATKPFLLSLAEKTENRFSLSFLSNYADHFYIEMIKR